MPGGYDVGVTVGKFYPPHKGHEFLIEFAAMCSKKLYVFVVSNAGEFPYATDRCRWLKDTFCNPAIEFMVVPNLDGLEDDSDAWGKYTTLLLPEDIVIDAVFTSENYGDTWAQALGCAHIKVDLERRLYPTCGTDCRDDPFENWKYLNKYARIHYGRRVCIVGGESTGKSTLTERLAAHYNTTFSPEYGRLYVELAGEADEKDPLIWPLILHHQPRLEDEALVNSPNGLVICDTDLLTTAVWYERWVGDLTAPIFDTLWDTAWERADYYDLYLFLDHKDVPWIQDGTRSEENNREWFSDKILGYIDDFPHHVLTGSWEDRFNEAVKAIDQIWNVR